MNKFNLGERGKALGGLAAGLAINGSGY